MKNKKENLEIPKTLMNFKKHRKNWYENNIKGILTEEEENIISAKLKEIIEKSEYCTRLHFKNLEGLLQCKKFKNQFETGSSGGTMSENERKKVSENLFGLDLTKDKLEKNDFEKYGYLFDSDFLIDYEVNFYRCAKFYGDMIIRFHKENLKKRVTFTINDSMEAALSKNIIADKIENPSVNSIDKRKIKNYFNIFKTAQISKVEHLIYELDIRYIELQFHGGVFLRDIKEICFTKDIPQKEILDKLKEENIKLYKLENKEISLLLF